MAHIFVRKCRNDVCSSVKVTCNKQLAHSSKTELILKNQYPRKCWCSFKMRILLLYLICRYKCMFILHQTDDTKYQFKFFVSKFYIGCLFGFFWWSNTTSTNLYRRKVIKEENSWDGSEVVLFWTLIMLRHWELYWFNNDFL